MLHRYIFPMFLAGVLLMASCASARKQFEKGHYDRALEISANKLQKNPADQKHIDILLNAYSIANERDLDQISALKSRDDENSWDAIYQAYRRLDRRQEIVKSLPKLRSSNPLNNTDFRFVDYSREIQKSRQNAVERLYSAGVEQMNKGDRFSAREAYNYFSRAYQYDQNYLDVRTRMEDARYAGTTRVLFSVNKLTMQPVPLQFEQALMNVNLSGFNRQWLQIDKNPAEGTRYDFFIEAVVEDIILTPERVRETSYLDKTIIEDGWDYDKNPDGSIRKDSLGKPIKVPIYREITAKVFKTELERQSTVNGRVLIYADGSQRRLCQDAVFGTANYYYAYGTAKGDSRALSEASVQLLKNFPRPFPPFQEMVMMASTSFNNAVYDKIRQYKSYLD